MDTRIIGVLNTKTQPNISSLGILDTVHVSGTSTFSNIFSTGELQCPIVKTDWISFDPVRVGFNAGLLNQTGGSIAIGLNAGLDSQGTNCIAIGTNAGQTNQRSGSIAIGLDAGSNQASNSIILNASGNMITGEESGATYMAPLQNKTQTNLVGYDSVTNELTYFLDTNVSRPILTRISSQSQTLVSGVDKFLTYNNVRTNLSRGTVNISYNSTTGEFINNTIKTRMFFIIVQCKIGFISSVGSRSVWIESNINGRICESRTLSTPYGSGETGTHLQVFVSYLTVPNEILKIGVFQDSGSNQGTGAGSFKDCGIMFLQL